MAKRVRPAWAKKPDNPHNPRDDGSSYVELVGGPLGGCWMKQYLPMGPEEYVALGCRYHLERFGEGEREFHYVMVGWADGVAPDEINDAAENRKRELESK